MTVLGQWGVHLLDNGSVHIVELGDADNDGDLDIFVNISGLLYLYENQGYGNFAEGEVLITLTGCCFGHPEYTPFTLADMDGDSDLDILYFWHEDANPPFNMEFYTHIGLLENLGDGTFGEEQLIYDFGYSPTVLPFRKIIVGDIDSDQDLDFITYQSFGGSSYYSINVYFNFGSISNPQFLGGSGLSDNCPFQFPQFTRDLLLADVGSSSDMEVIVGWSFNLNIISPLTSACNTVLPYEWPGDGGTYYYPYSLALGDIDIDGDDDLVVVTDGPSLNSNGGIYWAEKTDTRILFDTALPLNASGKKLYLSDIDNDNIVDIVTIFGNDHNLVWYQNDGTPWFSPAMTITDEYEVESLAIGDLDGDGDNDIVCVGADSQYPIVWFENFIGNPYRYQGEVFYDANQNQVKDSTEQGISLFPLTISPVGAYSFSDNGEYEFVTDTGQHTISLVIPPEWGISTIPTSYSETVTDNEPVIDSLDFGVFPNIINTKYEASLTGAPPRCNEVVPYWITLLNIGTSIPSGTIELQLDPSLGFVSSEVTPDSIYGQSIYWHYDDLFFGADLSIKLYVQMPSEQNLGDTIASTVIVNDLDNSGNVNFSFSTPLVQVILCAYDPNDKLVEPEGMGEEGYVHIDSLENLEYTVRFQNTGNDTAFTVMIRDKLSEALDLQTFQFLGSSHPAQIWIEPDREIVFLMEDILLPDSTTNEPESHGFVKFSLAPLSSITTVTPINNTADIYFDANPAIRTNTTLTTLHPCNNIPELIEETTICQGDGVLVFGEYIQEAGSYYDSTLVFPGCYTIYEHKVIVLPFDPPLEILTNGNTLIAAAENVNYQWIDCFTGMPISGETNQTFHPGSNSIYRVELSSGDCSILSACFPFILTSVQENELSQTISIYPNPVSDFLIIESGEVFMETLVEVNNILGASVKKQKFHNQSQFQVNVSDLPNGVYITTITVGEQEAVYKIIKY